MAKSASNKAYLASKRKETEKDIAQQQGMPVDDSNEFVDIFDSQAHHLLACLEKTTVRTDCSNSRLTVSCIEYPGLFGADYQTQSPKTILRNNYIG